MIIKLHFNGELFRFSLEDETSFSAFSNHVRKLYLQGVDDVKLRWKDEDGDLVLLTSEPDWQEARRWAAAGGHILHVHAGGPYQDEPKNQAKPTRQEEEEEAKTSKPSPPWQEMLQTLARQQKAQQSSQTAQQMPDMSHLLQMASSPQAAQIMQSLGINPDMATQFLGGLAAKQQQQKQEGNDNNAVSSETPLALCDECDLPIESGALRWSCLTCDDYDAHDACLKKAQHDKNHQLVTNFASADKIETLISMDSPSVDRDMAVFLLNQKNGDVSAASDLAVSRETKIAALLDLGATRQLAHEMLVAFDDNVDAAAAQLLDRQ